MHGAADSEGCGERDDATGRGGAGAAARAGHGSMTVEHLCNMHTQIHSVRHTLMAVCTFLRLGNTTGMRQPRAHPECQERPFATMAFLAALDCTRLLERIHSHVMPCVTIHRKLPHFHTQGCRRCMKRTCCCSASCLDMQCGMQARRLRVCQRVCAPTCVLSGLVSAATPVSLFTAAA